ncbi:DUF5689 domain-containing protein [Mesonia aquimarina]|uniref:DUF5689 domain-containing protein n=1 Tax=Mesonia aquimarina TaxID=1504967 RepID=UPI0013CEC691|nr:DUF5689 domain-containing protein [Mesonia aquimarina]
MKNYKIQKITGVFLIGFLLFSCVADDDFDLPESLGEQENIPPKNKIIQIADVINDFAQNEEERFSYADSDKFMEGYVISSDESGNFYQELIVQDKPENPTAGIKISIAVNSLYTHYQIGQKIYVALHGFSVGRENGVISLGVSNGEFMEAAPAQFEEKIIRDSITANIIPLPIEINEIAEEYKNLLVEINEVQFPENLISDELSFAGESFDEFDGERTVESCLVDNTFTMSTSTFADFKSLNLPDGSGKIRGILSRNFEDTFYVLRVNTVADIAFDKERCEPIGFNCGLSEEEGSINLFSEDFESFDDNDEVSGNGWTNFVETGTSSWEVFIDNTNAPSMGKGAIVDPSGSDESSIAWLISPEIDFSNQENETLSFKTSNSFADQSNLKVLISFDWDGVEENILLANWKSITAATIVNDDADFRSIINSGIIDLSCVEASAYIAFKYIGSGDEEFDGAYELDDIKISH